MVMHMKEKEPMTAGWNKIHLNDTVKVKLTPHGLRHYREKQSSFNASLPARIKPFPIDPPLDEEGFYQTQLWQLMNLFGSSLYMGGPMPFEASFKFSPIFPPTEKPPCPSES